MTLCCVVSSPLMLNNLLIESVNDPLLCDMKDTYNYNCWPIDHALTVSNMSLNFELVSQKILSHWPLPLHNLLAKRNNDNIQKYNEYIYVPLTVPL